MADDEHKSNFNEDGIKEMIDTLEEYYESEELEEIKEKPKKTVYDFIGIGLIIVSNLIYILANQYEYAFQLTALSILLFVIAIFMIKPIHKYVKDPDNCSLLFRASFYSRIMIFLFFTGSIVLIFLSSASDLYYSYWIAFLSIILLSVIEYIEIVIEDYRTRRNHNTLSRIFHSLLNIALCILCINAIYLLLLSSLPNKKDILIVDQLEPPNTITLYSNDYIGSESQYFSKDYKVIITDQVFINQLFEELEHRTYYPMDIISELNYIKMEHTSDFYYRLDFQYNNKNIDNLFASDAATITIIGNRVVYENHWRWSEKSNFEGAKYDYYYLELSNETMQVLNYYVDDILDKQ